MTIEPIAHIECDFPEKFGLPRQGAGISGVPGRIVFEPPYNDKNALRGLEGFSHIWVIWGFDVPEREVFQATVRPPRLGGNERVGVFATRSPFRPNPLGLTCVKIESLNTDGSITVSGIDMKSGTEIYDIKPYLPHADVIESAKGGFAAEKAGDALEVVFPDALLDKIPREKRASLIDALKQDPRPHYQAEGRTYGFSFAGFEIKFEVNGGVLTVTAIE